MARLNWAKDVLLKREQSEESSAHRARMERHVHCCAPRFTYTYYLVCLGFPRKGNVVPDTILCVGGVFRAERGPEPAPDSVVWRWPVNTT